ncbi:hypothetical protein [Vibrio sp. LaRot3]|uniref:hypothetical protein n=1 Tax=Vibrio sp. LaRot3 TaxID=2998829 RepID=UPI0022CE069A|nr:hypothetical protein [Vibrio sp. LaRot3]MDA0148986.1 hypothetical protein [Vibrio sp. LaRot3]
MQNLFNQLIAQFEQASNGNLEQLIARLKVSQHRFLTYKELLIHRELLDESEVLIAYTHLSKAEKQLAKLGLEAISFTIDALEAKVTELRPNN